MTPGFAFEQVGARWQGGWGQDWSQLFFGHIKLKFTYLSGAVKSTVGIRI